MALAKSFSVNICGVVDPLAAFAGFAFQLCGDARKIETPSSIPYFSVELEGSIDSLALNDSRIELEGGLATSFVIDAGGVSGGSAPRFAPCDRGSFPGCLATPTGAALIDWMRQHAPSVPDGSLSPLRLCVPGTPVRVAAGRFEGLRWIPARFEQCRLASIGVLPTVVLPSLQEITTSTRLHLSGQMQLDLVGSGKLAIEVPLPYASFSVDGKSPDKSVVAEFEGGFFVELELEMIAASATLQGSFDDEVTLKQTWTPSEGWRRETIPGGSQSGGSFNFSNPDSIRVRFFRPKLKIGHELRFDTPWQLGRDFKFERSLHFGVLDEVIWTREQMHPDDPDIDNWHMTTENLYEIVDKREVTLPGSFIRPPFPLDFEDRFEFGRTRVSDTWGLAALEVEVKRDDNLPGNPQYLVELHRSDTLPRIPIAGAVPHGPRGDWGNPIQASIGRNQVITIKPDRRICHIDYSDATSGVVNNMLRKVGFSIPNYFGVAGSCDLLVAEHQVSLIGVEPWCTVDGGPVRTNVWPRQSRHFLDADENEITRVTFQLHCTEPVANGALAITGDYSAAAGSGLQLLVDGVSQGPLASGETRIVANLLPGNHQVKLLSGSQWCSGTDETVNVPAGDTVAVMAVAMCFLPEPTTGTIAAAVNHSGTPAGAPFPLVIDGDSIGHFEPGVMQLIPRMSPSLPVVLMLLTPSENCRVTSANPMVRSGGGTASFGTECTDAALTTVAGTVSVSGGSVPATSITTSGGTFTATGPLAAGLGSMAGQSVRAWGVLGGTSLDLYGHELLPTTSEQRWNGVLLQRGGKLWLIGAQRIELVSYPPTLTTLAGATVWIGGHETSPLSGSVVPRIWGVIPEGT
ncbi:MAG TPA: hypothetical protein PLL69_03005 [Gemmatimonadales bacterium]|nr:hypothetical protein [Gemmatimonadales bacterium]